jgi:hypothetical protein
MNMEGKKRQNIRELLQEYGFHFKKNSSYNNIKAFHPFRDERLSLTWYHPASAGKPTLSKS